ncbi:MULTISPECIES: hypothetical protein [Alphaproteobacteria]|uniref:hypothetical protein n=1 Tax=Alphaproteobacteria TaxID=28211 RepID=UPI003298BF27
MHNTVKIAVEGTLLRVSARQHKKLGRQDWPSLKRRLFYFALKRQERLGIPESYISPEMMVQTAIEKTYAGERPWNEKIELYTHLAGCIASLYSNEFRKLMNQQAWEEDEKGKESHVLQHLDDFVHLQQLVKILRTEEPNLADFFMQATYLLMTGVCSTDAEVAKEIGMSPSSYHEKRKKVGEIMNRQGAELERPADVQEYSHEKDR